MAKRRRCGAVGMRWPYPTDAVLQQLRREHRARTKRVAEKMGVHVWWVDRALKQYCREVIRDAVQSGAFCIPWLGVWRWLPFKRPEGYYRDARWFFSGVGGWLGLVHNALESAIKQTHFRERVPDGVLVEHAMLGLLPHVPSWDVVAKRAQANLRLKKPNLLE